jgi:hypothetical protein
MVSCPQHVPLPLKMRGDAERQRRHSHSNYFRRRTRDRWGESARPKVRVRRPTRSARSGDRPPAPWGIQRARKEQRIHPLHADPILSCENGSSRTRVVSLGQLVSDLRGEATVWGSRSPDATNLKRPNALPIGPSSGPLSPKVLVLRSLEVGRREDRGELRFSRRQVGLSQARSDCRVVAAQRPSDRNLDGLVGADRAA